MSRLFSWVDQMYSSELEKAPFYGGFSDWLDTFEVCRGKALADDMDEDTDRVAGKFKVCLCMIFSWTGGTSSTPVFFV